MKKFTVVAALLGCLVLAGCGSAPAGTPMGTLQSAPGQADAAAKATCSTNRSMISAQYSVVQAGASTGGESSFADVVAKTGAKCPTGGTYTWDAATNKVSCSQHGE